MGNWGRGIVRINIMQYLGAKGNLGDGGLGPNGGGARKHGYPHSNIRKSSS